MPRPNHRIALPLFAGLSLAVLAGPTRAQEFTEQIEPPPAISDEEVLEPEVTIRRRGEDTVEEYRVNGRLYMIKITPDAGPSYYLVDNDGDGNFTKHMGQIYEDFEVPKWVIFSW